MKYVIYFALNYFAESFQLDLWCIAKLIASGGQQLWMPPECDANLECWNYTHVTILTQFENTENFNVFLRLGAPRLTRILALRLLQVMPAMWVSASASDWWLANPRTSADNSGGMVRVPRNWCPLYWLYSRIAENKSRDEYCDSRIPFCMVRYR